MKRRTFNKIAGTGVLATSSGMNLLTNLLGSTEYKMKKIRKGVGYFSERGGTIGWYITKDKVVVVDTQFPDPAAHLLEGIRKHSDARINYVLNTHHHGDHTAGNIVFKDITDSIVAHENSKANQARVAEERGTMADQVLPDATYSDSWQQKVGDELITMNYWGPAHTNGDSQVHFENANVVHLGDLVFNRRFPYIDKSAGANIENWASVLDKISSFYEKDTTFICGHAGKGYDIIVDYDDIAAFRNYLLSLLEYVDGAVKAGKSDEEILKVTTIPGAPEWIGDGIERSLNAAIMEVREGK